MKLKEGMRGKNNDLLKLIDDLPVGIIMAEVGCYAGESTLMFLQSEKIKKLFAIDPWDISYFEYDNDLSKEGNKREKRTYNNIKWAEDSFDYRIKEYENIVVKLKMTLKVASVDLPELDFIYIDGSHLYKNVMKDIILAKELIKVKGIIAGHDYRDFPGVIKAVNQIFGTPDKFYPDSSWIIRL